ncbi:MAG TPA: galactokinase [Opitutaceae bacterium]|nr:galactokinase [Opitutaceae bacterium]
MKDQIIKKFAEVYGSPPTVVTRAPGRLEFIGNHTDYNGGTVLGVAIDRGVWVAVRATDKPQLQFFSDLAPNIVSVSPRAPGRLSSDESWANYPLGVWVSMASFRLQQPGGLDFLAMADLPPGAGLSSSAAIELSSALAFLGLTGQTVLREELVLLGKHAENNFVGVPCGILDQGVSGFGKKGHLVFIDCIGPRFETIPLDSGAHFWVFNTHSKHALIDSLYATRHRECMEAAQALGLKLLMETDSAKLEVNRAKLPEVLYRRAKHIVDEIARVAAVKQMLVAGDLKAVGRTLNSSHASSKTFFENSTPELDFLAETLATTPKVYGARLTGGGFGGAVMALTDAEFSETDAKAVGAAYQKKFNQSLQILHCQTGEGAETLPI